MPEGDPIGAILNPGRRAERPEAERATGPQTPSRASVVGAMGGVAAAVRSCGDGGHATVPVRVVFAGDTGRVRSARVDGAGVAPPVRSCIAQAVRGARVPPFRQSTFSVSFPFRL